ncbi:MAG TPA: M14 family metallopeptidase [Bryobacteraceae bacterium]|nr:M14 family metallopeptidase [Bryobacteraceae bacterium]HPU73937.1 M14 family metallopeptidase [Bryobacteraceae bacterium]
MRGVVRLLAVVAACTAALLAAAGLPSPESHFGHKIGADRTVLDWDRVVSYYQSLARSSDRILVRELGKSTEGRPFISAVIASPETLRRLDRYAWIQKKLADPRITPEAEAEKLIAEGKAVVLITCSIHATEIASSHTAIEFVYRLLTEDTARNRAILDNTIFLLVPSLNPDGMDIVTRWYRKTLGTPYEGTSPPELYQKYTGHDNNRDWYFFTQAETRLTIEHLHNVWHPQIVYDIHQQGPYASRMFVPPWMDPIEPNIDPILVQQCNMIGAGIAADLTAAGKTGVVINALYDFWSPARHYQAYHGGMRILSESASVRIASPIVVKPDQIQHRAAGYDPRQSSWNHLEPWLGGEWRLRDIIDYQMIAMQSVLYQAACRREDLLRNFYRIGCRAVARKTPWAFAIPAEQRDPGALRKLLETLRFGLVEIEQAAQAFEAGGRKYAAGTYLVRMQQPYSAFAKTLLERQRYPDLRVYPGGPPKRPYDVTAHTLPLLLGVEADAIESPVSVELKAVAEVPEGPVKGILPAASSDTWRTVNAVWKAGGTVWRDPTTGDFSTSEVPNFRRIARPRVGLYKSHIPSMDEGWTRWVLEQFGFEYASVRNPEIRRGGLRKRFDVIIFPDQGVRAIAEGYQAGEMPEEYTGGLGDAGAAELKRFASEGGTLVFLNNSTAYAIEKLGVEVRNVVAGVPSSEFYSPGSLLNVRLDPRSQLSLGLPGELAIWSEGSPAWDVPENSPASVAARYPSSGILASGWLLGEKHLAGKAALVEYPMGSGRIVLFGMRPQYRGQSYATFKLLFNALL